MKRPTKKAFYEHMSGKLGYKYKSNNGYMDLLEIIHDANESESSFMSLAELTLMSKADKLLFRYTQACKGKELTPTQVDEYLLIVEYGLEYVQN
jgi:hypothetical protein